jgi:hypothetical protein
MNEIDSENIVLNFDNWLGGLPPDRRAGIDAHLKASGPLIEQEKKRLASMAAVALDTGLDPLLVNERWDTVRAGYAEKMAENSYSRLGDESGGEWMAAKDDEDAFYGQMSKALTKRKDYRGYAEYFSGDASKSALVMKEKDRFAEVDRINADAQALPGMDEMDAKDLLHHWVDVRMRLEERAAPLRPLAREIYGMLSKGKEDRLSGDSQAGIEGAIDQLAMLGTEDRGMVIAMLKSEGGTDMTGAVIDKALVSAQRGLIGQLRGYASNADRGAMLLAKSELNQGGGLVIRDGETVEQAVSRRLIAANTGTGLMLGPYAGIAGAFAGGRNASEAEVQKARDILDAKITRNETAQQAIGILEGTIDPVKPENTTLGRFVQRTAIDVGTSFGAMAPIILPQVGFIIAQGGYADEEYQRLREEGNDPATAQMASQITGAVQAGIERAVYLFNFVPTSTIARLTAAKAGSKVMGVGPALETSTTFRVLSKMGTIQAAEYGEEIGQAAAPILTGLLGEKLGWNMAEQSKFQGEISQFKEEGGFWRPEVFLTVMALSVFGGGYSGIKSSRRAQEALTEMLGDQTKLEAFGITPAKAAEIVAMPEAERKAAYFAEYPNRNVQTPGAIAAQQQVAAQVDAQMAQGQVELNEMKTAGVSITRTTNGFNVVDDTDGTAIPHTTAEEAMTTVRSIVKARGMAREETFLDALGEFTSMMQPGRTIQLSNKSGSLLQELEDATTQNKEQWVESIWDRADQERKKAGMEVLERDKNNPDSAAALDGMIVLGRSKTEAKGNVAKSISLVFREGRTLDLVEEQAENDLREAVIAGNTSLETMRGIIERIEKSTGDKYLLDNTETGITEAWSSLVRLYTTGTRKGKGNKITAGARSEMASSIRSERQRLRSAEAAGVTPSAFAKMREYLDYLKGIMGQVYRLQKARDAGLLDDLEAMIRESVGLKEQDALEAKVAEAVPTTYNLETGQGTSTFGYSVSPLPSVESFAAQDTDTQMSYSISPLIYDHNKELRRPKPLKEAINNEYTTTRKDNILYRPDRYYRVIDDNAWADFQNIGYFRPNPNSKVNDMGGYPVLYAATGGQAARYKGRYVLEVNPVEGQWTKTSEVSGYVTAEIGSVTKDSAVRVFEKQADGTYKVVLDNIGDQALFDPTEQADATGYSISTKRDADYMAAVESGDVATQQALVDEAAKAAGYNVAAWHGTPSGGFVTFNTQRNTINTKSGNTADPNTFLGAHFAEEESVARRFMDELYGAKDAPTNPQLYGVYLRITNPLGGDALAPGNIQETKRILADHGPKVTALAEELKIANDDLYNKTANAKIDVPVEILEQQGITAWVDEKKKRERQAFPEEFAKVEEITARLDQLKKSLNPKSEVTLPNGKVIELEGPRGLVGENQFGMDILSDVPTGRNAEAEKSKSADRAWRQSVGRSMRKNFDASGFDAILYNNAVEGGVSIIIPSPNQIKSADPITYDDQGNVIPLSQRFNPESENIGYSIAPTSKEQAKQEEKRQKEIAAGNRIASVLNGQGHPTGPTVAANEVADAKEVPTMIPKKYIGKRFFLAMADLLGASGSVRGVPMQGGAGYPLMHYVKGSEETTAAWASSRDGVIALLRDMVKTGVIWKDEKTGRHYALLAPNAMDQETHKSNANNGMVFVADMAHAISTEVINPEDNQKLLTLIRGRSKALNNFPDFTNPDAPIVFGRLSFENRAEVVDVTQSAEAIALGSPSAARTLLSTRDASYHGVEPGSMLSMLLIDIDRMATQVDGNWVLRNDLGASNFGVPEHMSYDTIIPGRMIAHFRTPIPLDVAIPGMITEFKAASDAVNAEKIKKGEKPGAMGRPAFLLTRMPKGINGQLLTEELFADIESVQKLGEMGVNPPAIRAFTEAVEGTWSTITKRSTKGLAEFLYMQARSEAANTMRQYSKAEMQELVKAGTVELYTLGKQVGDRDVGFSVHLMPDGTRELRSVINNTGVKGMLPLIVARAIEAGANRLEVYAVPTAANPNGVLPEAFAKHGWTAPQDREGNRIVIPYDRNKLGKTETERAHKEAALKDYWTSQGWDGQKMPDRVIMSHGGIRTETIADEVGQRVYDESNAGTWATSEPTPEEIRGPIGDGVQGDVPAGGSAGGTIGGRRAVVPRGANTTLETLTSTKLTPAQLRTLGLDTDRFEALKQAVAAGTGYSITTAAGLENIKAQLDKVAIDPDVRFKMMQRASENLGRMARDIGFRDDVATAANDAGMAQMEQQQATALAGVVDRYSAEEQQRLRADEEALKELKVKHETALQDLSVKADIEAGGAQADGWTADQKDALKVRQRLEQTTLQAQQRAEKLALETKQQKATDAARAKEQQEVKLLKQEQAAQRKANAQKTGEREQRATMLDYLAALDTILMPFPAEVRNKVGGFVSLAGLRTNASMEKYLKDRVEKLNNAVENYLRKDYVEQIKDLIKKGDAKRASGKKPGGKLGAEGHVLFDAVKAAAGMSEEETNKAIMELSDAIEKARMDDPDAVPVLAEKLQAAVMFGDLNGKTRTARDLANALTWLKENYKRERTKWRIKEENRLNENTRLANGGVDALDGPTTDSDRLNSTSELGEFRAGSSGFSGAMRALFGKDSELFKRWTAASRKAIIKRTIEFQALQKDWRDLKDRLYGKGWKGDRKLYDDIVEPVEKSGVLITDKMKKSRETIPVNTAENILAGKAPELAEQYTDAEKAEMRVALDANILEKRPKDTISLTKISGSTVGSEIMLSQGQAMHISLMWRQAQGRAPMEAHGYTEETITQVEAFMSPEAKAIRDWIASRYTNEWGDLNAVFAGMFGVNLPQIENYSPLKFWSQQRKELANPDPSGGPIMAQGGMSTGMLKERVEKHGAEPRIVNAIDVFFDHMRQVAHFKAFAELAREMRGVMSKPEIRRSLAVKHGKIGTELMDKWMDAMEQGGLTQKPGWFESQLSNMGGARAVAVLAWNFKSAFTNVLNLLGMARKMPPDQYLKGIVRLFGGRLNWWVGKGSVFQSSEIIQRRINSGMSPEMQAGMARIATMRPGALKAFMEGGMALHAYSDAIFTSGSVAIAYDFHLREFLKDGIAPEEAQRMALAATEQSIADVTQPTEFLDKSTVEMERNAMARAIFSFQSDPRQKMALQMEAYAEKDWGRLVKLVIVDHVVTGLIMQTITNAWRDANDDDDGDDVFDPLHWQLSDYLIAAAIGPWSALPMFGPAIDAVGAAFKSGPAINESILTSAGSWAGRGVRMVTSEKGKVEPYEMTSDVIRGTAIGTAIMTGDARFAVVARVGSTAFDLLDNYIETEEESISHELKMRRLKDKELNPPAEKTAEEEAQAKVDKAAKNLRELERLREEQKGK